MAPGRLQHIVLNTPLELEGGSVLPRVEVVYESWGKRNAADNNTILLCHAFSGSSHAARHDPGDGPGWWEIVVGPGKAIDTNHFHVICPNILGSCSGTTGPASENPESGKPYGSAFPAITVGDMAEVHARTLDALDIGKITAVAGGSLGGHQALAFGLRFPERAEKIAALACSHRLTHQAMAASIIACNAIRIDPDFHGGDYYEHSTAPRGGLAVARMLANTTYFSDYSLGRLAAEAAQTDPGSAAPLALDPRLRAQDPIGHFLAKESHAFVRRFDANSFLVLSEAMERFDLGNTREELVARFRHSAPRWLLVSFSSDTLFPPYQVQSIAEALECCGKSVHYCEIPSDFGHDSFLLEPDLPAYGKLLREFLAGSGDA